MELEEAYTYQLNPRSYAESECVDTNVSLQRRLGDDMDSCAFTHGTLMRACDIEENKGPSADEARAYESARRAQEEAHQIAQAQQAIERQQELAQAIEEQQQSDLPWASLFPPGMSSAYILLIVVVIVLLGFAMMRRKK
jgi:hypothetical protein